MIGYGTAIIYLHFWNVSTTVANLISRMYIVYICNDAHAQSLLPAVRLFGCGDTVSVLYISTTVGFLPAPLAPRRDYDAAIQGLQIYDGRHKISVVLEFRNNRFKSLSLRSLIQNKNYVFCSSPVFTFCCYFVLLPDCTSLRTWSEFTEPSPQKYGTQVQLYPRNKGWEHWGLYLVCCCMVHAFLTFQTYPPLCRFVDGLGACGVRNKK